jgi:hypothetical protein
MHDILSAKAHGRFQGKSFLEISILQLWAEMSSVDKLSCSLVYFQIVPKRTFSCTIWRLVSCEKVVRYPPNEKET